MLFRVHLLTADRAVQNGCIGDLFQSPITTNRQVAFEPLNKINQKSNYLSRSYFRDHSIRTLEYNRRTLSPNPRYGYIRHCFAPLPNLQNQADNSPPGRDVHLI